MNLLPTWPTLSVFLAASALLAVVPGPGVLYIVSRSLVQGRRSGIVSVFGVAAGNLGNALTAALGLAAVFAVSAPAFTVVKYAGAAYLVWLGVKMWRKGDQAPTDAPAVAARAARVFRDGMLVSLLNPKTTIFFAAFLPQFVTTPQSPMRQSIALGVLFVLIAAVTDSLYALSASAVSRRLARGGTRRIGRRLGGSLFIGLGLFAALTGARR
jgi:threonine/homoserine/homoserine lactone efflux protein